MKFCPKCLSPGGIVIYSATIEHYFNFKDKIIDKRLKLEELIGYECLICHSGEIMDIDLFEIEDVVEVAIFLNGQHETTISIERNSTEHQKLLEIDKINDEDLAVIELVEILFNYIKEYLNIDVESIKMRIPNLSEKVKEKLLKFLKERYQEVYVKILAEV